MDEQNNEQEQNIVESVTEPVIESAEESVTTEKANVMKKNTKNEKQAFSIASLCCGCGILSMLSSTMNGMFPGVFLALILLLPICAVVFGAIGRKKGGKGIGTAGMICGIVGLIWIFYWIFGFHYDYLGG